MWGSVGKRGEAWGSVGKRGVCVGGVCVGEGCEWGRGVRGGGVCVAEGCARERCAWESVSETKTHTHLGDWLLGRNVLEHRDPLLEDLIVVGSECPAVLG